MGREREGKKKRKREKEQEEHDVCLGSTVCGLICLI